MTPPPPSRASSLIVKSASAFLVIATLLLPATVSGYPAASPSSPQKGPSNSNTNTNNLYNSDETTTDSMSPLNSLGRRPTRTVMVTGANGFLASYIVKDLLAGGHTVHACVRDATREHTVQHLQGLPGASPRRLKLFSTGDLVEANASSRPFDSPMKGCDAVFHAATPLNVKFGSNKHNGEEEIYLPAMVSTQELLECLGRHADSVQCLVLTSSMAAVAPRPEPPVKDESHWSDPERQRASENWYGCTKTCQEQLVRDWVQTNKATGTLSKDFCYTAICPTMVIGPQLRKPNMNDKNNNNNGDQIVQVEGTMGSLQKWLRGGRTQAPNDSMSFIHVEDCAKMHTRILELQAEQINEHQRYMSLIESLHWNDILELMRDLYPNMPTYTAYQGDDKVTPTQFRKDHMESLMLKTPIKTTKETLQDSIQYLHQVGALE